MSSPEFTDPPEAPSRKRPASFSALADGFVRYITIFVGELKAAIPWFESAVAKVEGIAGANAWIEGQSYQAGETAWSGTDYQIYRARIAHASSTDPAEDPENWLRIGGFPAGHIEDRNNPHGVTVEQIGALPESYSDTVDGRFTTLSQSVNAALDGKLDAGARAVDSAKLEGKAGAHYLAFGNFTGKASMGQLPVAGSASSNKSNEIFTTAQVQTVVSNGIAALVDGAPASMNSFREAWQELQTQDSELAALMATVDGKLPKSGGTITGNLTVRGEVFIGKNGGGDGRLHFQDDNSNTWRTMFWDDSANDWRVEDNGGAIRTLYHSGNLPLASKAEAEAGSNNSKMMTPLRTKEAILAQQQALVSQHLSVGTVVFAYLKEGVSVAFGASTSGANLHPAGLTSPNLASSFVGSVRRAAGSESCLVVNQSITLPGTWVSLGISEAPSTWGVACNWMRIG